MKNLITIFAGLFLMTIAVQNANASDPQTVSANASATIITPMTITKNIDLNFGNIAAGSSAGTVVISTTGVRTSNNVILPSVEGTVTAAQFTVTGLADASYGITFPNSVTITSDVNSMTIDAFTQDASEVLTGGTETFGVGATLNIDASQAVGEYTGTFIVTVDYE